MLTSMYIKEDKFMKLRFWLLLISAVASGLVIGWVDTRPTWDDAGITAAAILLVTGVLGAAMPSRAWIWALTVGGLVLLLDICLRGATVRCWRWSSHLEGSCGVLIQKLFPFSSNRTKGNVKGAVGRSCISNAPFIKARLHSALHCCCSGNPHLQKP